MPDDHVSHIFNYDVFVSYKSEQESWARRLANTLREFGLTVWRDHDAEEDGLKYGDEWSDAIRRGIGDSERMVVLWSDLIASNGNSIVHQEITQMHSYITSDDTGKRRYIPISLDGTSYSHNHYLSTYHGDVVNFTALHQVFGDDGADEVNSIAWYEAIKPLIGSLGLNDVMEIRVVVAAMTRQQAVELTNDPVNCVHSKAFNLMLEIMSSTSPFNVTRYGDSPDDWKPFPQLAESWSIAKIIEAYDRDKRFWLHENGQKAKWIVVSYSDEIVALEPERRMQAHNALQDTPCLVIVDPVSLMHQQVFNQIIVDSGLMHSPQAYFIGIAPFVATMQTEIATQVIDLMDALGDQGILSAAYERFGRPFEPHDSVKIMDVENHHQFMRWLQVAADNIVSARQTPMRSYQRRGRMHPSHLAGNYIQRQSPSSEIARMLPSSEG